MIESIRSVIQDRQVVVPAPEDMPDGTPVVISIIPVAEKLGFSELPAVIAVQSIYHSISRGAVGCAGKKFELRQIGTPWRSNVTFEPEKF